MEQEKYLPDGLKATVYGAFFMGRSIIVGKYPFEHKGVVYIAVLAYDGVYCWRVVDEDNPLNTNKPKIFFNELPKDVEDQFFNDVGGILTRIVREFPGFCDASYYSFFEGCS